MHRSELVSEWLEGKQEGIASAQSAFSYYTKDLGLEALSARLATPDLSDADAFQEIASFFTPEIVQKILKREQENFSAAPIYASSLSPIQGKFYSGFVLFQSQSIISMLVRLDPYQLAQRKARVAGDQRTISFSGTMSHTKVVSGKSLLIRQWRINPFDDSCDLRMAAPALTGLDPVRLHPGDEITLGAFEEFEFLEADGPMLLLLTHRLSGPAPVALEYDVDTRKVIATTAVSQEPTRLQMLSTVLRLFEREDAFEAVQGLLSYPQHFVRWHGMREMLALDAERALPRLLEMAEADAQPSVRRAARTTIETFFPAQISVAAA